MGIRGTAELAPVWRRSCGLWGAGSWGRHACGARRVWHHAAVILVDASGVAGSRPGKPLFADLSVTVATGKRLAVVGINKTAERSGEKGGVSTFRSRGSQ